MRWFAILASETLSGLSYVETMEFEAGAEFSSAALRIKYLNAVQALLVVAGCCETRVLLLKVWLFYSLFDFFFRLLQ